MTVWTEWFRHIYERELQHFVQRCVEEKVALISSSLHTIAFEMDTGARLQSLDDNRYIRQCLETYDAVYWLC